MPVLELDTPNIVEWHVSLLEQPQAALRIAERNNYPLNDPQLVCNDKLEFRIYFYSGGTDVLTNVKFPSGTSIGTNALAIGSVDPLFEVGEFEEVTVGSGEDERVFYKGAVSLETEALNALFGSSGTATIYVNIQVSDLPGDPATKRRTVAYFEAIALRDGVVDGGDPTAPPAGYGRLTLENLDGDTLIRGSLVTNYSAGMRAADHSNPSRDAIGFLDEDVAPGFAGEIILDGRLEMDDWTGITGSPTLTPGRRYFLATLGTATLTPTSTPGYISQAVGLAVTPTRMEVRISRAITKH